MLGTESRASARAADAFDIALSLQALQFLKFICISLISIFHPTFQALSIPLASKQRYASKLSFVVDVGSSLDTLILTNNL